MPTNKDFKRLVRGRMQKTGESYTAARAILLQTRPTVPQRTPTSHPVDFAKLAGMSDATIKAKTGCTWERWVWALDRVGAHEWPHRDIAEHVHTKYKIPGWWSQSVTVGYERIKGLRVIGQRRDGGFEAAKSKTFPVPVGRLYRAWKNARTRARWLPGVSLTIRTAIPDRSMRITWPDRTTVALWFSPKGAAKSQVAVQHLKLPAKEAATRMKEYWAGRLEALADLLTR
jgi:uncharacterized protein YndB with AHSA1/START domain